MATNTSISAPISNRPSGEAAPAARKYLKVMLLASAALMVAWSFAVPVFEGPDEPAHWRYANCLNQSHTLPIEGPNSPEAAQPPLYYLLIAPLAVDTKLPPIGYVGDGEEDRKFNLYPPRVYQNTSGDLGLYWPFRIARLVSVLFSVLAVWFCALAGTEASGSPWTGLLVGGLVAFWPMFTFRGMNVSNDALVTMLSALALYLIVRVIKRGFTWGIGIFAALAGAGAFMTKINAVVLPVALLLALISEKAPWRAKLLRVGALGALMLVIAAPWLIRNQHLYGDFLAQKTMFSMGSGVVHKYTLGWKYFRLFFAYHFVRSFIGDFGWLTLPLPVLAYVVYMIALVSAGACWMGGIWQHRIDFRLSAILSAAIALNLMSVIHVNLSMPQPQGRYMFPTMPAMVLLLGLGLESRHSWSGYRTRLTLGGLAVINLIIIVCLVIPAYWPPVIIK